MDTQNKFTKAYFFEEVCAFRELFGTKSFWQQPAEKREKAVFALGFVYINLFEPDTERGEGYWKALSKEDNDHVTMVYDSTIQEYARREMMVLGL